MIIGFFRSSVSFFVSAVLKVTEISFMAGSLLWVRYWIPSFLGVGCILNLTLFLRAFTNFASHLLGLTC